MKTKKHKIGVEIPVGRYCDGCVHLVDVADYDGDNCVVCGLMTGTTLELSIERHGGGVYDFKTRVLRCPQCLEKFGLEESDGDGQTL